MLTDRFFTAAGISAYVLFFSLPALAGTATLSYTYDNAGRLIEVNRTEGTTPQSSITYTYDASGNTLTKATAVPVNGACGSANGGSFQAAPATGLCSSGTATTVTGTGPWDWTCTGSGGGATVICSANTANGACGSANGQSFFTMPASNLCSSGKASTVTGKGPWSWTCGGVNGGKNASCSASIEVNGACGPANGEDFLKAPTSNLCSAGTASKVSSGSGQWSWSCAGSGGGTSASCLAHIEVNGACGSANGENFLTAPASNLCSSGTASALSGTGPWSWTCQGANGGKNATNCSANLEVYGACGPANGENLFSKPVGSVLCTAGKASNVSGSGPWSWACQGANGGTTAKCSANLEVNGACGPANGESFLTAPASKLCNGGTASRVTGGNGQWSWSCAGSGGGTSASCTAHIEINGACGSSSGGSFSSAPTANLCTSGTASALSGTGPWSWTCTGAYGGKTASCTAKHAK